MSEPGLRWPNLFLVGAAKAGTTSLYRELARHPAIYMSPMKEPHFFSQIEPAPERKAFFPHVTGEDEYLALFEGATTEELLGEASTSYLWDGQAAERIKRVVPEARILIMLRDPVDRAYSQYWNDVREGIERRSFLDALVEEQRSGPGAWGVSSLHIDCGRYADQVERYLDRFGARVQVLFFEDFVGHEASTIADAPFLPGRGAAGGRRRAAPDESRLAAPEQAQRRASRQWQAAKGRSGHGSTGLAEQAAGGSAEAGDSAADGSRGARAADGDLPARGRATGGAARKARAVGEPDGAPSWCRGPMRMDSFAGRSARGLGKEGPGLDEVPVRAGEELPPGGLP